MLMQPCALASACKNMSKTAEEIPVFLCFSKIAEEIPVFVL